MHEPSLRTCANASRRMTTLKSLQRQVLRATIVVTSAATVTYQKHSRIRFCGRRLGVLRSDTRTAGGAYGGSKWVGGAARVVATLLSVSGICGLAVRTQVYYRGLRRPKVSARLRSFPIHSASSRRFGRFTAIGRIMSMLAMPSCDRKDSHPHLRARTGGSSRHRSKKRQRPQGALTAFKRMTQQ
jgi:hypothetical protein